MEVGEVAPLLLLLLLLHVDSTPWERSLIAPPTGVPQVWGELTALEEGSRNALWQQLQLHLRISWVLVSKEETP